jgi:hypothetical protein
MYTLSHTLPGVTLETVAYTLPNGETVVLTHAAAREFAPLLTAGFTPHDAPKHPASFANVVCTRAEHAAALQLVNAQRPKPPSAIDQFRNYASQHPESTIAAALPEIEAERVAAAKRREAKDAAKRAQSDARAEANRVSALRAQNEQKIAAHRREIAISCRNIQNASAIAASVHPSAEQREADWRRLFPGAAAQADRARHT